MTSLQTNRDLFPRRGLSHCECRLPTPCQVTPLKPMKPGDWRVYGGRNVPSGRRDGTLPESLRDDLYVWASCLKGRR